MIGLMFIAGASVAVASLSLLVWYRLLRSQDRALALTVCSAILITPILTFFTLEYRFGFEWSELSDSPAGGLPLYLGAIETVGIWVCSIVMIVLAHLSFMERYSDWFWKDDDEAELFE